MEESAQPRRSRVWLVNAVVAVYAVIVLALMWWWDYEPPHFDVARTAEARVAAKNEKLVTGSVTVSTLMSCAETLLDKRGGYLSNDKLPPGVLMDNVPNWEFGVLVATRDLADVTRNEFSRSQTQSTEDDDLKQAAPQPSLDRVHGNVELLGQLIATPAAVVSEKHNALLFRVELAEAGQKPLEFLGHLPARERRRRLGGNVQGLRLLLDRDFALSAHDVDSPIASHRHHPRDGARHGRVELMSHVPDFEIGFLHDLVSQFGPTQDTQKDPVQFRAGRLIELLERGCVALGDGCEQPH